MNICFYCDTIFSFGGVQRVLAVIAKSLSERHNVTILTRESPANEDRLMYELNHSGVHFHYLNLTPINRIEFLPCKVYSYLYKKKHIPQTRFFSQLYGYSSFPHSQRRLLIHKLNDGNYDTIIGVHAFLSLQLASIRTQLNAKRVIGWMHTSFDAFFNTPGFYLYEQKNQFRHEIPRLDDIVVLSDYDREKYNNELHINPIVIYNPLTLQPQGQGDPSYKHFLSIGRMSHLTKGFDILIEAFASFAARNEEWMLDIVGEGPEREKLNKLVVQFKLEKRISIHPFTKEIQRYYTSASVFILSSRWEGFPLVLAEAMSHKLPIIASDLPIVKELLGKQTNALIFTNGSIDELAQRMQQVADYTSEQLDRMGIASLQIAKSLQLSTITCQWEKIL